MNLLRRIILILYAVLSSLAAAQGGEETENSDIDLCLVFEDDTNLTSREMILYKASLHCVDEYARDIVFCTQKHLLEQKYLLYRLINRDGVELEVFSSGSMEDN